jgi:TRAP-type C4-dicarboxylate transport system permease small subunit
LYELAILLVVVAVVMAVTAAAIRVIGPALRIIEYVLLCGSILTILFIAFFVGAEVFMRYVFNAPIQGHLELSELMLPIIVFLALSYTQATHGNIGMDLVLDALPPKARHYATMAALLISIFICSVLAYFSAKNALQLWRYDDVTMTPPYIKTWPSAAAIPLGFFLVSVRIFVQLLHMVNHERFQPHEPVNAELHRYDLHEYE